MFDLITWSKLPGICQDTIPRARLKSAVKSEIVRVLSGVQLFGFQHVVNSSRTQLLLESLIIVGFDPLRLGASARGLYNDSLFSRSWCRKADATATMDEFPGGP